MKKKHCIASVFLLVTIYVALQVTIQDDIVSTIVTTVLTIIAAVAFWVEFRANERTNEAQVIMELNNQFISNERLTKIEWILEKYYARYLAAEKAGESTAQIKPDVDLSLDSEHRQDLINYLVYLEGIAALVNRKVLHLDVITNLMAYRYFIAVNNPIVQEKELKPYKDYYQGIYQLYPKWSKEIPTEKIPMWEYALVKEEQQTKGRKK